ncbi:hypothetical protein DICA1_E29118 [Diutina catenulata]
MSLAALLQAKQEQIDHATRQIDVFCNELDPASVVLTADFRSDAPEGEPEQLSKLSVPELDARYNEVQGDIASVASLRDLAAVLREVEAICDNAHAHTLDFQQADQLLVRLENEATAHPDLLIYKAVAKRGDELRRQWTARLDQYLQRVIPEATAVNTMVVGDLNRLVDRTHTKLDYATALKQRWTTMAHELDHQGWRVADEERSHDEYKVLVPDKSASLVSSVKAFVTFIDAVEMPGLATSLSNRVSRVLVDGISRDINTILADSDEVDTIQELANADGWHLLPAFNREVSVRDNLQGFYRAYETDKTIGEVREVLGDEIEIESWTPPEGLFAPLQPEPAPEPVRPVAEAQVPKTPDAKRVAAGASPGAAWDDNWDDAWSDDDARSPKKSKPAESDDEWDSWGEDDKREKKEDDGWDAWGDDDDGWDDSPKKPAPITKGIRAKSEPAKSSKSAKSVEPAKPSEPAVSSKPVKPAEPTKPSEQAFASSAPTPGQPEPTSPAMSSTPLTPLQCSQFPQQLANLVANPTDDIVHAICALALNSYPPLHESLLLVNDMHRLTELTHNDKFAGFGDAQWRQEQISSYKHVGDTIARLNLSNDDSSFSNDFELDEHNAATVREIYQWVTDRLASQWATTNPILFQQFMLAMIDFINNRFILAVLNLEQITEYQSAKVSAVISQLNNFTVPAIIGMGVAKDSVKSFNKLHNLDLLVNKHLKSIMEMFYEGELYDFSTDELIRIIKSIFVPSELRDSSISEILEIRNA